MHGRGKGRNGGSPWFLQSAAFCILLVFAVFLSGCGDQPPEGEQASLRDALRKVELPPLKGDVPGKGEGSVPGDALPGLEEVESEAPDLSESFPELPDFTSIRNVERKKRRFFEFVGNLLRAENMRIRRERYRLLKLFRAFRRGEPLSERDIKWLRSLCGKYRESFGDGADAELFRNLLLKVDIIPVELGVAQAANESAWGTSRFAWVGNNLFGQWCFEEGCGLVPMRRSPGSTHEVETYSSPRLSVRDYMNNLNSHPAYHEFRVLRYKQRRNNSDLDGRALAQGLLAYSGIGQEYVERLRSIMEQYIAYRDKVESDEETKQG